METETNKNIKKVVQIIKQMLIEQYLNFNENHPNKSMEAAMTGNFDNIEEINRRVNINIDLSEEAARNILERDYYLCKNRITKFNRTHTTNNEAVGEKQIGYMYMLIRKADIVCCKWIYINDINDKANIKLHQWMKWNIMATNWVIYTLPQCEMDGFVYGSLME